MSNLRVSSQIVEGKPFRIGLDELEAILDLLDRGAKTFRVLIDGSLVSTRADLESLRGKRVGYLDVESHDPFLSLQMGLVGIGESSIRVIELAAVRDDPTADHLFERIEEILVSTVPSMDWRTWLREDSPFSARSLPTSLTFLLIVSAVAGGGTLAFASEFGWSFFGWRAIATFAAFVPALFGLVLVAGYASESKTHTIHLV